MGCTGAGPTVIRCWTTPTWVLNSDTCRDSRFSISEIAMVEIFLIRHGQSSNNALDETARVCDPGLTELGRRQARRLADHLSRRAIDFLYCSPFRRSLETTRPIAQSLGIHPKVRADIFEQGGCYSGYQVGRRQGEPGLGFHQLQREYPEWDIDPRISPQGWWNRPYETAEQAAQRAAGVRRWMEMQLVAMEGRHALIIHADFKYLLLRELLGAGPLAQSDLHPSSLWNAGITALRCVEDRWECDHMNDVSFLPRELRSR